MGASLTTMATSPYSDGVQFYLVWKKSPVGRAGVLERASCRPQTHRKHRGTHPPTHPPTHQPLVSLCSVSDSPTHPHSQAPTGLGNTRHRTRDGPPERARRDPRGCRSSRAPNRRGVQHSAVGSQAPRGQCLQRGSQRRNLTESDERHRSAHAASLVVFSDCGRRAGHDGHHAGERRTRSRRSGCALRSGAEGRARRGRSQGFD